MKQINLAAIIAVGVMIVVGAMYGLVLIPIILDRIRGLERRRD